MTCRYNCKDGVVPPTRHTNPFYCPWHSFDKVQSPYYDGGMADTNLNDLILEAAKAVEATDTKITYAEMLQNIYEDLPWWRVLMRRSVLKELQKVIAEARVLQAESAAAVDVVVNFP